MSEKIKVRFLPDDILVNSELGQSLLDVALDAGVFIPAACGGTGACGQCKVKIIAGEVDAETTEKITKNERDQGFVLACQTKLKSDVIIEMPQS